MDAVFETGAALQGDIRARLARSSASAVRVRRFVYAATGSYAALFGSFSVLHYLGFGYSRFDLGNMTQAVWSTAHGRILETTSLTGDQVIRLGGHVDPLLILLTPLWLVWPSPVAFLVLQAIAVSLGALPVYWLARKHLSGDRSAALFALAYLLFPATQFNAFTPGVGFHPVSLAPPLILFAIWFLDEDRLIPFSVFALLAASTKEEIPAAVGCLGLWYAVRKGHHFTGLTIFGLGVGATLLNFVVIIPHYAHGLHPFADRYARVGGTPGGILHKAATDPAALVGAMFSTHKGLYLLLLLGPLLGLWLLEPVLFLGALPDLLINLLSSKPEQTSLGYQYTAGIIPFVFAAAIVGAKRLSGKRDRLPAYVLAGVGCVALFSPLIFGAPDVIGFLRADPAWAAKQHALRVVPASAPVAASNHLAASLSERRFIYVFPFTEHAKWVVLDRADRTLREKGVDPKSYAHAIVALEGNPHWRKVYDSHGVEVLKRR